MAVAHLNGVTSYGAADKLVEFFAALTTFLVTTVGWTQEAAANPTDRIFSSIGEGAAYTKLFVHIWQDPGTNHIRGEVQDDLAGTHVTTAGSFCDADIGVTFRYYLVADLDTIFLTVPYRETTHFLYLGIIESAAITLADETYQMIATVNTLATCRILRHHTGAWDQGHAIYEDGVGYAPCTTVGNERMGLGPVYVDRYVNMAGQMKFIGCVYAGGSLTGVGDQLASIFTDAVWQMFSVPASGHVFAVLVEGTQPVSDQPDGPTFTYFTGLMLSEVAFMDQLVTTLTAAGWTYLGAGDSPHPVNRLFYSSGNDGTRDIYIMVCYDTLPWNRFFVYLQDDAIPTHRNPPVGSLLGSFDWTNLGPNFNVYINADKDCFNFWLELSWMPGPPHRGMWAGMTRPPVAELPAGCQVGLWNLNYDRRLVLRNRYDQAVWGEIPIILDRPTVQQNTNALAYDPNTYYAWPYTMGHQYALPGGGVDIIGDMGLLFYTDGAAIAHLDTITVGAKVYTVIDVAGNGTVFLAIRSI